MTQTVSQSVENNFTKGLITEATGLSFPENAAFDTDNCIYTLLGDVTRREGFDYEANFAHDTINRTGLAMSTYKWNNVGGDGLTQIVVRQVGGTLYFYQSSAATIASPLSAQKLSSTVTLSTFSPTGAASPDAIECQYTDGNGYLFVFHPNLDSFYCTFSAGVITATKITLRIRDFTGILEQGVADNFRPPTKINEHVYNLQNQGWTAGSPWSANSSDTLTYSTGNHTWTINASGLPISGGDRVAITGSDSVRAPGVFFTASGTVVSYVGFVLTINIDTLSEPPGPQLDTWTFTTINNGYINTWVAAAGNYPSNADVWWQFKDSTGAFNPATQISKVTLNSGPAPKGYFIINAFTQQRGLASSLSGLTDVTTSTRPKTGTWFQGRVWYAGIDASFAAAGDMPYSTWTENIYFSQIVTNTNQFGQCYQINDPTSETLFDILPTDGGVLVIQGSGTIYKLFPIQNGLLVFAANGIWFITGSQGIGFSANDYTVTRISGIQSTSSTSFVNVMGYPIFWNEEGIYGVAPAQGGALTVNNITLGTILTFYSEIPFQSKKFARGDYNPLDYTVQWCYRSTNETSVTDRYEFDRILCFNVSNKAFYTYSLGGTPHIHGINYVAGPGGSTSPDPVFKYLVSVFSGGSYNFSFAEERDNTHYLDWFSQDNVGVDYTSFFVTGYQIKGQAQKRFQPAYTYLYLRNDVNNSYRIQGQWDFGITRNSGRWSGIQEVNDLTDPTKFGNIFRRHKIRGRGLVYQMKVSSVSGKPFDIVGWSIWNIGNASV